MEEYIRFNVQIQIVILMFLIFLVFIKDYQLIQFIFHQLFHQLLCGLKIQIQFGVHSFKYLVAIKKYQQVAHLFMHLMVQFTLHPHILLVQEHLHFLLMMLIGRDI